MSEFSPDSVMTEAFGLLAEGQVALWLELYAAFPAETRAEFPDVVRQMLELSEATPTAMLLAPLYGEESDPEVRGQFIESLAAEPCIESLHVLSLWRGLAATRPERRAIRSALEQFAQRGLKVSPGAQPAFETQVSARMSSADGMGSYRVVISIRMDRAAVFLAFAINVDAGLREAERMGADAADFLARFGEEYGLLDAEISPARAVLTIREAARRSAELGRELPEGWAETSPWLDKIPSVVAWTPPARRRPCERASRPLVSPPQSSTAAAGDARRGAARRTEEARVRPQATRLTTRQLALRREFETWFLPPVAELCRRANAYLAKTNARSAAGYAHRTALLRIVSEYVGKTDYRQRLVSMLHHQVELYALSGETAAARAARRSIDEIQLGETGRGFLRVFAERSLECLSDELSRSDPLPPDERRPAWVEALRPLGPPKRRDVARVDFALLLDHVLATELDLLPLARRPTEAQLIEVVRACADLVIERLECRADRSASSRTLLTQQDARRLSAEFARAFREHTRLGRNHAAPIARVLADHTRSFANLACGQYCLHACPAGLDLPGQRLYDIEGHPARLGVPLEDAIEGSTLRERMRDQLRRARGICDSLELLGPNLGESFDAWDECTQSALDNDQLVQLRAEVAESLRDALRSALEGLPRLAPSSDPDTLRAWEAFSRVYPGLPVELVSRLMARSERPSDVLSLLLCASGTLAERAQISDIAASVQQLWNATPRPELSGKTPNQVLAHEGNQP